MLQRPTLLLLALAATTAPAQAAREGSPFAPSVTPTELGLAGYAKVLCSAVFVSGRDFEEAARNSGFGQDDAPRRGHATVADGRRAGQRSASC